MNLIVKFKGVEYFNYAKKFFEYVKVHYNSVCEEMKNAN